MKIWTRSDSSTKRGISRSIKTFRTKFEFLWRVPFPRLQVRYWSPALYYISRLQFLWGSPIYLVLFSLIHMNTIIYPEMENDLREHSACHNWIVWPHWVTFPLFSPLSYSTLQLKRLKTSPYAIRNTDINSGGILPHLEYACDFLLQNERSSK